MKGELRVRSEPGRGSIFEFAVPIEPAADTGGQVLQPDEGEREVIGLEPGQPSYRLLVVEDDEPSRRLLVRLLTWLGFDVQEAANGQEAIEKFKSWSPHLIWMDMRMPVMDGYEATKRIKAAEQGRDTVIIALTASVFDEERKKIMASGCNDLICKPFCQEDIFDVLIEYLGVRFAYEGQPILDPSPPDGSGREALTPAALVGLSPEWITRLEQAAVQGNLNLLQSVIEQIRENDTALADALAELVHNFEYDTILTLIGEARSIVQRG